MISEEKLTEAKIALAALEPICEREGRSLVLAVATQAIRVARNGVEILDAARELDFVGAIATGAHEAELAYLAVTGGRAGSLVCDLGSHSMQLAWRQSERVESLSIAAGYEPVYADFVRHAGTFAQARHRYAAFVDREVRGLPARSDALIAIAMNTMARFVTGKQKAQVTDLRLSHARIREKAHSLGALTQSEFAALKATTPMVNKALAALIFLDYMLARTGHERTLIAQAELPVGLIVEHFERDARP